MQCGISLTALAGGEKKLVDPSLDDSPTAMANPPHSSQLTRSEPHTANHGQEFAPGTPFGARYRIESLLGKGGMGAVYKAYDLDLERMVALKLVRSELIENPESIQRFKQELLLASRISHRNVLRIHDLGDVDGAKFISMAYVEGEDLKQRLRREKTLPVEEALKIAGQLCRALEAAHREGVVHRDLKPQNILLDRQGHAFVSDFGLAKSLEASAAHMTRTGELLGTPLYMSPEQVEGVSIDHRSDIYSLGLILYEMVTGELPFGGDSLVQVMFQRVSQPPASPRQLRPELPEHVTRIILRCLEKDPGRRYQSAREVVEDLEQGRSTSATQGIQISLPIPAGKGWWVMIAASLLSVALLGGLYWMNLPEVPADQATLVGTSGIPPLEQGKFVAMIPFRVLGDAGELGFIAEGLGEALSAKLFQLQGIHISSSEAVANLRDQASLVEVGRELGANLAIQGTLQGNSRQIRIIVNLTNILSGVRIWSDEFSGLPEDLLTLEDRIYGKLIDALQLNPASEELARGTRHPTENIEAYDLYLRGKNAMRSQQDEVNVQSAVQYYEKAIKQDSGFALAYAGLARACLEMYGHTKESFWSEKALAAANTAKSLNSSLLEVHFALGHVYRATGRTAESIQQLKQALELAPNSDEGYRLLGRTYLELGRRQEALQAFQKAVDLNPYFWISYNALGTAYFETGQNDKALQAFRRVTELEPQNPAGYENIGVVYFQQGKWDECIPYFEKALAIQPYFSTYSNVGTAYFYLKRYREAVEMYEKAVELNPNEHIAAGNLADAYRWAGEKEKAVTAYERAIALAFRELQVNPRQARTLGHLGLYYAKKGDHNQAMEYIDRARSIDETDFHLAYQEALVYSINGQKENCLKALREALERGFPPLEASQDPELQMVHNLPEFRKLIREFEAQSG